MEKEVGYTKRIDQISKLRGKKKEKKSGASIPNTVAENGWQYGIGINKGEYWY